jgi:tetratricopeptide (TPR) repeat protein
MRALFRRRQGDAAGALEDFETAIAHCRRHTPDHLFCEVLRANRAGHLARIGRGEEALRESDAALAAMERMQRADDNEYAQALEAKAFALQALGRSAEARATQERAIARYEALFGAEHREAQRARGNLAKL